MLGGTSEARELVERLRVLPEVSVDLSLARSGAIGGTDGLVDYLRSGEFDVLVDATHPFATVITAHAVAAAALAEVPLLVLRRPGWSEGPGDDWRRVPDFAAAAAALAALAATSEFEPMTVFLAIGRKELAAFAADARHTYLLRTISPLPAGVALPQRYTLLLDRGPFDVDAERALLVARGVGVVVTKDSGGDGAVAKLVAARELGLPVIMIDRPSTTASTGGVGTVPTVGTVAAALRWLFSSSR